MLQDFEDDRKSHSHPLPDGDKDFEEIETFDIPPPPNHGSSHSRRAQTERSASSHEVMESYLKWLQHHRELLAKVQKLHLIDFHAEKLQTPGLRGGPQILKTVQMNNYESKQLQNQEKVLKQSKAESNQGLFNRLDKPGNSKWKISSTTSVTSSRYRMPQTQI